MHFDENFQGKMHEEKKNCTLDRQIMAIHFPLTQQSGSTTTLLSKTKNKQNAY